MKGFISKIQKYSTKDGPGLRSTVFFVGCNLKCLWCANPELIEQGKKILYHKELCVKCGKCVSIAHQNSIQLTKQGCIIDRTSCANLQECAENCYYDAYETIGYELTPEELFSKLIRDNDFYIQSGGGVTFSGGEAALQSDFLIEVSKLLKKEKIHIALDTAGLISSEKLQNLLPFIDLVLYDIKAIDNDIHRKCTFVDNSQILKNAQLIAKANVDMNIRLVVVPGYNDNKDDFLKRIEFINGLGQPVKQVDILKYHKLAEGKYIQLGIESKLKHVAEPSDDFMIDYVQMAKTLNVPVSIGG